MQKRRINFTMFEGCRDGDGTGPVTAPKKSQTRCRRGHHISSSVEAYRHRRLTVRSAKRQTIPHRAGAQIHPQPAAYSGDLPHCGRRLSYTALPPPFVRRGVSHCSVARRAPSVTPPSNNNARETHQSSHDTATTQMDKRTRALLVYIYIYIPPLHRLPAIER